MGTHQKKRSNAHRLLKVLESLGPPFKQIITLIRNFGLGGLIGLIFGIGITYYCGWKGWIDVKSWPPRFSKPPSSETGFNTRLVAALLGIEPDSVNPRVRVFSSKEEADSTNRQLFQGAKDSICIVTVHGETWIRQAGMLQDFEDAIRRVKVRLCLVDPAGAAFDALSSSRIRGLERLAGVDLLHRRTLKNANDEYRQLKKTPEFGKNLTIYHYYHYPYVRFSVFDGLRATFVLVPFLSTGTKASMYYTEDPWVVECLLRMFDDFRSVSRVIDSDSAYDSLWK